MLLQTANTAQFYAAGRSQKLAARSYDHQDSPAMLTIDTQAAEPEQHEIFVPRLRPGRLG